MAKGMSSEDLTMLSMALIGYESEKRRIEERIQELRGRLNGGAPTPSRANSHESVSDAPSTDESGRKRRTLSPAARKRIAAAQKKRWAEHRKQAAASAE